MKQCRAGLEGWNPEALLVVGRQEDRSLRSPRIPGLEKWVAEGVSGLVSYFRRDGWNEEGGSGVEGSALGEPANSVGGVDDRKLRE